MSEETTVARRRGFGFAALMAAALVGAIGGGFASTAIGRGFGPAMMHAGWGGHGHHGPMTAADMQEHAERIVGHLGWAIDATADQKQKLTAIAITMMKDLEPAHAKLRGSRDRAAELLRQPKTDRAALEALRAEHVALADDISKRLTAGLADASDVLTPQQRAKLAEHWRF